MSGNQNGNGVTACVPDAATKNAQEWRKYCCNLQAQVDALREQVGNLRAQRRAYASLIPISDEIRALADLPVEELLTMCEGQPSLEDLIRECNPGPSTPFNHAMLR